MLVDKAYVIDGRKLQIGIEISIDLMVFHVARWNKHGEEADYRRYRINKRLLMQALEYQGLTKDEQLMVVDYALDLASVETRGTHYEK